jgi:hypothetical protein
MILIIRINPGSFFQPSHARRRLSRPHAPLRCRSRELGRIPSHRQHRRRSKYRHLHAGEPRLRPLLRHARWRASLCTSLTL